MGNERLLHPSVATAFYGKFTTLHQMQEAAIPPLVEGQNMVISARTGSGKTEAVAAPLVSRYLRAALDTESVTILHIAPTKALANDLERRLLRPVHDCGLRIGVRHGDRDDLRTAVQPHFLITTPESLDVLLFRGEEGLGTVHAVIVDEIHLVFNTQRGLHLAILLNRLRQRTKHPLQWVGLSATICNLEYIRDFFFGPSEQAFFLRDSATRYVDAQVRILPSLHSLRDLFSRLLGADHGKYLIFANSRRECEHISQSLTADPLQDTNVLAHYSSLSPEIRLGVERQFNESSRAVCIATSTLELGIDIGDIDAVLLFGPPSGIESFLQRIGRGNRRSTKTNVICLVRPDSPKITLEALIFHALVRLAKQGRLPERRPFELFGAAAQQTLSHIGSDGGGFVRTAELAQDCSHLPHLQRQAVEGILAALAQSGYLQAHGYKNRYGAGQRLYDLIDFRMIYGNFPLGSQEVALLRGKTVLGHIPRINLLRIHSGDVVRFAGKAWRIRRFTPEGIDLDPSPSSAHAVDILYPGAGPGVDPFVLTTAWEVMHEQPFDAAVYSRADLSRIQAVVTSVAATAPYDSIPVCRHPEGFSYLTFAGRLVNKAIALVTGQLQFTADETVLTCRQPIQWNAIPTDPTSYESVFGDLVDFGPEQTIYQTLLPTQMQRREALQTWLNDSTIREILERLQASATCRIEPAQMGMWGL